MTGIPIPRGYNTNTSNRNDVRQQRTFVEPTMSQTPSSPKHVISPGYYDEDDHNYYGNYSQRQHSSTSNSNHRTTPATASSTASTTKHQSQEQPTSMRMSTSTSRSGNPIAAYSASSSPNANTNNKYYTSTTARTSSSVVSPDPVEREEGEDSMGGLSTGIWNSGSIYNTSTFSSFKNYNTTNNNSHNSMNSNNDGVGTKSCLTLTKKNSYGTTNSRGNYNHSSTGSSSNKFAKGGTGTSVSSRSSNRSSSQNSHHTTTNSSKNGAMSTASNRFLLRNTFLRGRNHNNNSNINKSYVNSTTTTATATTGSTTNVSSRAATTTATSSTQSSQNSSQRFKNTKGVSSPNHQQQQQEQQQQQLYPNVSGSDDDIYNSTSSPGNNNNNDSSWLLKDTVSASNHLHIDPYTGAPWGGDVRSPNNQNIQPPATATIMNHPTTTTTTAAAAAIIPYDNIHRLNESSSSIDPKMVHLLTLPPVEDRGSANKKRIEYEQRIRNNKQNNNASSLSSRPQQRRGLYEGEIEPIGSRGQEARVIGGTPSSSTFVLPTSSTSSLSNLQIIKPVSSSLLQQQQQQQQAQQTRHTNYNKPNMLVDIPEESHDSSSISITTSTNDVALRTKATTTTAANKLPDSINRSNHYNSHQIPQQHENSNTSHSTDSVGRMNALHQNRPSRLVPPPPSRVKKLLSQPPPPSSLLLSQEHRTVINTNNDIDTNRQIQQTQNDLFNINNNDKTSRRESNRAVGDIPWERASQPPLQVNNNNINKVLRRESSRAVGEIPWEPSSEIHDKQNNNVVPSSELNRPQHIANDLRRVVSTVDSELSSASSTLHQEQSAPPIAGQIAAINGLEYDKNNPNVEELHATATNAVRMGNYDVALSTFQTILQMQLERYGRNHAITAAAYHNLGTVYAKQAAVDNGDSDEIHQRQSRIAALECFQAAARCARDASPDVDHPHPNVAVSLVRVGFLLLQSKQYQNAIITFQEALRIRITHYGKLHALSANLYNNLGVCCLHMGEFEQGLYHLEQALEIQRHLVAKSGRGSPKHQGNESAIAAHQLELADTLFNIGGLCLEWMRRQGPDARRADEAEAAFLECLQLRARVLGQAHPQTLQVKSLYGIAKSVPRPRRILKTSPSPASTSKKVHSYDNENTQHQHSPVLHNENVVAPPHIRRLNQHSRSPVKIPSMSPIRPLSEVSSIVNEDSMEATSIFRVSGSNNTSPQRRDVVPAIEMESQTRTVASKYVDRRTSSKSAAERQPPVLQITISREEDEHVDAITKNGPHTNAGTHIYMAPHIVPASPSHRPQYDDSGEAQASRSSFEKDQFTVDASTDIPTNVSQNSNRLPHSTSYDTEENCIISESGIDSDIGRIHYPLAWNRAGILQSNDPAMHSNSSRRDIVVVQPMRQLREKSHSSTVRERDGNVSGEKNSTGNIERDEIMARARAILTAHDPNNLKTSSDDLGERNARAIVDTSLASLEHYEIDDGIASLGGNWDLQGKDAGKVSTRDMLQNPTMYLPEIHKEASKQLSAGNTVDAYRLFDVVLQCQRHIRGPLHPDVAAALHNIGIVQLKAQNHTEALKAFEEAARVRKGSLGKDHPLVAVSLVKVGISLLLLHRFDDALWCFREALAVRQHALGPLHPSTARIYNNIGCVYVEFNEFKEARRAFEAALDVQRNALCNDADNGPLMFGAATTLCNLGYLYRYRDMHGMAVAVLKEAVHLQEKVLGSGHATVLSTIDNLADSCANSGNPVDALKYYELVLRRFRLNRATQNNEQKSKLFRAEAVLLYKMSRVYRKQKNRDEQLNTLKAALQAIRQHSASRNGEPDTLERRIHYDIRTLREDSEKDELKWI